MEGGPRALCPDGLYHLVNLGPVEGPGRHLSAEEQIEQIVVGQLHQQVEAICLGLGERRGAGEQPLEQEVVLEQAAPAAPAQLAQGGGVDRPAGGSRGCGDRSGRGHHQTARLTISSLILPMARVGFSPFGQTSTQFMIVWQRNRRYGSSRLSSRSPVAWSRLSEMKRYACSRPAGPTNLSGFHQKLGHEVEQLAQRMHSYRPSSSSRSSGDCRRSFSGGGVSLTRYGLIEWYCLKNCVMSTIRSRMTGRPGSGFRTIGSFSVLMLVRQARPFLPLMFIASEPHTPSRHERRKLRLGSIAFSFIRASSSIRSLPSSSTA